MYFQTEGFLVAAPRGAAGGWMQRRARGREEKRCGKQQDEVRRARPADRPESARSDVHRDFEAKAHISGSGFFPFHTVSPVCLFRKTRFDVPAANLPVRKTVCHLLAMDRIGKIWIEDS